MLLIKLFIYPEILRINEVHLPKVKIYIRYTVIHYLGAPSAPRSVLELTTIGTRFLGGGRLPDSSFNLNLKRLCSERLAMLGPVHHRKQDFFRLV